MTSSVARCGTVANGGCPGVPGSDWAEILVRQSPGESEYQAVTLKVNRRFTGRYQFSAHYTWGKDRDTDSNESSGTGLTTSDTGNLDYDWGLSDRDHKHRLVVTGMVQLPADFQISGILNYQSGTPYSLIDRGVDFAYCSSVDWNCPYYQATLNDPGNVSSGFSRDLAGGASVGSGGSCQCPAGFYQ